MNERGGWVIQCDRYSACLDVMGFKRMVTGLRPLELYDLMLWFKGAIRQGISVERKAHLRTVQFSDTVFIFTRDSSAESRAALVCACLNLFSQSLIRGVLLRGAWSRGLCTVDFKRSIFFGQSLIDAYTLTEDQRWFGVVAHHSFTQCATVVSAQNSRQTVIYSVPLKSGTKTLEALNWPARVRPELAQRMLYIPFEREEYRVREYMENTLAFGQRQWASLLAHR